MASVSLEVLDDIIKDLSNINFANSTVELRYCQKLVENINKIKSMHRTPEENYKALQALFSSEIDPMYNQIKGKVLKSFKKYIPDFEILITGTPNHLLNIPDEEWAKAEKYFQENPPSHPGETKKMRRSRADESPESSHSFIMVNGQIYAMANRNISEEKTHGRLGEGSSSILKVIQNRNGENSALKIEGMDLRSEDDPYIENMTKLGFGGQAVRHLDDEIEFKGENTSNKLYTVVNLVEGKDLFEYIHGTQAAIINSDPTKQLMLALKICKAVQELHDKRIIHGDLNPGNYMVKIEESQILVQLIDFVLSMKLKEGENEFIDKFKGSAKYMAPEVISEKARFSFASDAFAVGCLLQKDLRLPEKFYEGLLEADPKKRDSLNKVMLDLVNKLETYPNLNPEYKQFIAEYKIQLIENIEKEAELKAKESAQASPEEVHAEQSTTTLSNPSVQESNAIPEPITWEKLEHIWWQIMKEPPPAGVRGQKLESVKNDIGDIQEYVKDNNGGDQEEIIKRLRAIFSENSLNDKEKSHLEKLIKEDIPIFQISVSSPTVSQNKALVFSTIPSASLQKSDTLATADTPQEVPDRKSNRFTG